MTAASDPAVARRPLLIGAFAILGIGAAGALVLKAPALFGPPHVATPYDDLLTKLADRESAIRIGEAVLAQEAGLDPHAIALQLRPKMTRATLAEVASIDLREGRTLEVHGWILPRSLAMLCALAAKVR